MLLANHTLLETSNFEQAADFTNRVWRPIRGMLRTGKGQFHSKMNLAPLGASALLYAEVAGGTVLHGGSLQSVYTIATALSGGFRFRIGSRHTEASGNSGIVCSATHEHVIEMPVALQLLNVRVSREVVEQELSGLLNQPIDQPIVFDTQYDFRRSGTKRLNQLVRHFAEESSRPDSLILRSAQVAEQAERTLVSMLLEVQPHNYISQLNKAERSTSLKHLRRAEEFVRAALQLPITTAELARFCGVSGRTIRDSFLKHRGCSPTQFIRLLRLEAARRALKKEDNSATVSEIAIKYNFTHFGRFSSSYQSTFGELPSQTMRSSRGT